MGYIDAQNLFSDAQALSATGASTNLIDLSQDRNIGIGRAMAVVVTFDVALAGTSPTIAIAIQADDNAAFSSPGTVATTPALTAAAQGAQVVLPVPPDLLTERFIRLLYTLGGTTPTATVTAFLAPQNQVQNATLYAAGVTVA
jgi:hypothetical protein